MPGQPRTNAFLLSSASVLIGPMASLFSLNKTAHSIGLAKNVVIASQPGFVELTSGITNNVVMSVKNADQLTASMEVYEYSARNLAYAAGLDGSGVAWDPNNTIWLSSGAAAAAATTITVGSDITADLAVGDWIYLQNGLDDYVHVAKVSARAFATGTTTITFAGYPIPAGITFPIGTRIGEVETIELGAALPQPDLAARIIGIMPKDNRPIVVDFPKIKITRGFNLAFQTDNFTNMPFEFTPYSLVSTDTLYGEFGDAKMRLYPGV